MSWTEYDDKNRIKIEADKIKSSGTAMLGPKGVYDAIKKYDFNTPLELQNELNLMWDGLKKQQMKEFCRIVVVAAFKNEDELVSDEFSPFNYEF